TAVCYLPSSDSTQTRDSQKIISRWKIAGFSIDSFAFIRPARRSNPIVEAEAFPAARADISRPAAAENSSAHARLAGLPPPEFSTVPPRCQRSRATPDRVGIPFAAEFARVSQPLRATDTHSHLAPAVSGTCWIHRHSS